MNTIHMPLVLVTYLNMTNLPQPWKLASQPSCRPYDLHEMSKHPIEEYKECNAKTLKIKLNSQFRQP